MDTKQDFFFKGFSRDTEASLTDPRWPTSGLHLFCKAQCWDLSDIPGAQMFGSSAYAGEWRQKQKGKLSFAFLAVCLVPGERKESHCCQECTTVNIEAALIQCLCSSGDPSGQGTAPQRETLCGVWEIQGAGVFLKRVSKQGENLSSCLENPPRST